MQTSVLYSNISAYYGSITFKFWKLTNLKAGALFPAVSVGIRLLVFIETWKKKERKNHGRGYSDPLEDR